MNDMPKNNPKRRSLGWRLCRWLFLVVGAATVFQSGYFLVMRLAFHQTIGLPSLGEKLCFALMNLIAVVFLGWLLHRPFCRVAVRLARTPDGRSTLVRRALSRVLNKRMVPRYLFCLACLVTLVAVCYAVENWRGKRAWEKCRRELEAKGEGLDWNALIPAPVPDDQNIFKAPKMAEWFVRKTWAQALPGGPSKSGDTNAPFSRSPFWNTKRPPALLAEVNVVPPGGPLPAEKADAVLRLGDPVAREEAAKLICERVGACTEDVWIGLTVARSLDQIDPLHLVLQADTMPTTNALTEFLSAGAATKQAGATPGQKYLQAKRFGSQGFHVSLTTLVYGAADYLAESQPAVPDLQLLRQAVERPYAWMDGDYQRPFERPLPDFVRMRSAAQMLSERAKCYLLLGQPEAAWHELALVRDMCRMLEGKPASNCPTLVEAMIDVAITGLYTQVIADGLRLQAWREPELAAMQKQLTNINVLPLVRAAFNAERAATCRTFEITSRAELKKLFSFGPRQSGLWEKLRNPAFLFITFAPRGWFYQNMCTGSLLDQLIIGSFDVPNNLLLPRKTDDIKNQIETTFGAFRPYTFLATMAAPNFVKAEQTMARNQTLANEAFLACGLERYRLAQGQYPKTLEALVPQFAEKLPHDIIGGQPLKYHRTADGQFVLYSVGWNEKDDGGVPGKSVAEGDWVWP